MQDRNGLIYGDKCECNSLSCPEDPENGERCGGLGRIKLLPSHSLVLCLEARGVTILHVQLPVRTKGTFRFEYEFDISKSSSIVSKITA